MSEPRPDQDTTPPSPQHPGTARTPFLAAITFDAPAVNNNQNFQLSGTQDAGYDETPTTNDLNERGSGHQQTSLTGTSAQSRPLHGKLACQACVSRTSVSHGDD